MCVILFGDQAAVDIIYLERVLFHAELDRKTAAIRIREAYRISYTKI